jgi:hypothetical protein
VDGRVTVKHIFQKGGGMEAVISEREKRQRKMLLVLPVVVVPLMALAFHGLGGGKGVVGKDKGLAGQGINTSLPDPRFDPKKKGVNKLGVYSEADKDSMRLAERRKNDPYYAGRPLAVPSDSMGRRLVPGANVGGLTPGAGQVDHQADDLLRKLDQLKGTLGRQEAGASVGLPVSPTPSGSRALAGGMPGGPNGLPELRRAGDPDLDKLSGMLDKILRIQHPDEARLLDTLVPVGGERMAGALSRVPKESGVSMWGDSDIAVSGTGFMDLDDAGSDVAGEGTIEAVVARAQTLVSGESVELRLAEDAVVNKVRIPVGTLITGKASLSGERLQVVVSSIRLGPSVVPVSLEVVDLDGVAGIREEGSMNRDAAKQSADEAISTLGVTSLDPTLGGQAAAVGLQAARSLLSRKVRLVRVSLPAGYHVLLRNKQGVNH